MVDGHLQVPDEGVAILFKVDGEKLLVEVNKEELEVRATVPSATKPTNYSTLIIMGLGPIIILQLVLYSYMTHGWRP